MRPIYLLDTDVLIWHLRGRGRTVDLLKRLVQDGPLACSALTVSEVLPLVKEQELAKTEQLLSTMAVLPVGLEEARLAAALMRDRGPGYVDCHIAATALVAGLPVVTYNRQDFERTGATVWDTSSW